MAMLDDIKDVLRISGTTLNTEVTDLIAAARTDLILSGVLATKANSDTDALIKRAISTYCKANFGWDNPEAERFQSAYNMLKNHLCLSSEYTTV
jgi:uncharacterized phage protein (predicted DNA packaging)